MKAKRRLSNFGRGGRRGITEDSEDFEGGAVQSDPTGDEEYEAMAGYSPPKLRRPGNLGNTQYWFAKSKPRR